MLALQTPSQLYMLIKLDQALPSALPLGLWLPLP